MGLLGQGLKIAPAEAPTTGFMFGKGIYFADMFAKSFQYCYDFFFGGMFGGFGGRNMWNRGRQGSPMQDPKFMLLCEVALGEQLRKFQAEYIESLPSTYSV